MMLPEEGARQRTRRKRVISLASILLVLLCWYLVTTEWGLVSSLKLPSPERVLNTLVQVRTTILRQALVTFYRVSLSFLAGSALGVLVGLVMSRFRVVFALLEPLIESLRPHSADRPHPFLHPLVRYRHIRAGLTGRVGLLHGHGGEHHRSGAQRATHLHPGGAFARRRTRPHLPHSHPTGHRARADRRLARGLGAGFRLDDRGGADGRAGRHRLHDHGRAPQPEYTDHPARHHHHRHRGGAGGSATSLLHPPPDAQAQDEMVSVRYGVSPFQDTLLPVLGQEFGWYAEEGLDVEFVILGWTEVQEALAAGEVDVAINNISSVIATYDAFQFAYVYGFNIFDAGAALMAKPEFKSVEEFEDEGMERADAVIAALQQMQGRTVVTTGNTDMGQAVVGSAARVGLDPDMDITIIDPEPGRRPGRLPLQHRRTSTWAGSHSARARRPRVISRLSSARTWRRHRLTASSPHRITPPRTRKHC